MAQQTINVGTAPNDGTGTPLRTAFQYTNSNFSELYTAVGPSGNNIVVPGNATITGDLTVDTNTLKVDSANNRVGIGTASPYSTAESLNARNTALASGSAFQTMPLTVTDSTAYAIGVGGGINFRAKLDSTTYENYAAIWSYRESALISDYRGSLIIGTSDNTLGYPIERYRIASTGVATWSNVGGVAGTAMTLNSTGLGVGTSPSHKLHVLNTSLSGTTAGSNVIATLRSNGSGYDSFLQFSDNVAYNAGLGMLAGNLYFYTNGAERARIDTSGNLLLGTTSALQISNNPAVTSRIANLGTGSKGAVILRENEVSQYWGGNLCLQKVRGASTAVQNGDSLGVIHFGGFDGTNYVNTGVIQTLVSGAVSAGVVPVKIQVIATSGGVELTNTATAWAAISDERLKDIIEPISNAVAKVGLLRSVIGKYKTDSEGTRRSFLIAQDVQSALPEAVGGDENNLTVRYTEVIPLLVAAIKELTARVQTLETR